MAAFNPLRSWPFVVSILLTAARPGPLAATRPDSVARRGPTNPAEVEAFLDSVMGAELNSRHIAGAMVAVVRDGRLLFTKGYGFADVEARRPILPAQTLFQVGSISKLFTWTAVMQLVEQGKLDLDRDVNDYLDFAIPATYREPVTLRSLLTHTAGFEDDNRGVEVQDSAALQSMAVWLPAHQPARVRPPGSFSSYSNWGAALAGYIVERVSGQPFEDYLEQHLLGPLGMTRTTGRQPVPAALRPDQSQGYSWEQGRFVPQPWGLANGMAPAASISSTAEDMARWMLVHLNRGRLDGARVFSEATADQMHRRQFSHDPRVNGWGFGFYEKSSHGLRIIGHGGGSAWFHTDLALVPEEGLGIFVSFNTDTGSELAFGPFLDLVLNHYYPVPRPPVVEHGGLSRFAGTYLFNRRSYTTFQKALTLGGGVPIESLGDSALLVSLPFGTARYVPIDSMLFQEEAGSKTIAFRTDSSGSVTHAFLSLTPMMVLERQPWYALPRLHLAILIGGLLVFLATVGASAVRGLRRRVGASPRPVKQLVTGRRVLAAAAAANLVFVALAARAASDERALLSDSPTLLRWALGFPVLALGLVIWGGWIAWQLWRHRLGSGAERWRLTATVVVGLVFAWSLNFWNLLGWRF